MSVEADFCISPFLMSMYNNNDSAGRLGYNKYRCKHPSYNEKGFFYDYIT